MYQALYKRNGRKGGNPVREIVGPGIGVGGFPDGSENSTIPALRIEWRQGGNQHQLLVSDMHTLESLLETIRTVKRDLDRHYARKAKRVG